MLVLATCFTFIIKIFYNVSIDKAHIPRHLGIYMHKNGSWTCGGYDTCMHTIGGDKRLTSIDQLKYISIEKMGREYVLDRWIYHEVSLVPHHTYKNLQMYVNM